MTEKPKPHPLQVKLNQEMVDKLDDLRRGRLSFPTRADIIRELINKAHEAKQGRFYPKGDHPWPEIDDDEEDATNA